MKISEFASICGVRLVEVSSDWGGTVGYVEEDVPMATVCGFKDDAAAYAHWFKETFGPKAGKALMAVLKQSEIKRTEE